MTFNYNFDIISLLFLLIVAHRYCTQKQFPLYSNKLYEILLVLSVFSLVLDIAGSICVEKLPGIPLSVAYLVNMLYYVVEIILPSALVLYLLTLIADKSSVPGKYFLYCCIPSAVCLLAFFAAAPFGLVFRISIDGEYSYGPLAPITYICMGIYLLAAIVLLNAKRSYFTKEELHSIIVFCSFLVVTVVLQFIFPHLLLTGTGLVAAMITVFFTIQDPQRMIDDPTGLFNARAMIRFLSAEYAKKKDFSLVAVKLHGLHNFYMLYGRKAGDLALRSVGEFTGRFPRAWSFRYGDAVFVSLFRTPEEAAQYVEAVDKMRATELNVGGAETCPALTAVCINSALSADSVDAMLSIVENALDNNNLLIPRDTSAVLTTSQINALRRSADIENELRECCADNQSGSSHFVMYYQPIYCLKENNFCSAEALVRFDSGSMGRLSPAEFIPIIESRGLAVNMDEVVVESVFSHIAAGYFKNLGFDDVHINLSAASFTSDRIADMIFDCAKRYDIDPSFVVFELTETAASLSVKTLENCMNKLRSGGFKLALDDFGTGYSNLTRMLSLPFTHIKLDRCLIQDSPKLLEDIMGLFGNFDFKVVAEGVETEEQKQQVEAAKIYGIQGFYYSRPMPVDELQSFLNK